MDKQQQANSNIEDNADPRKYVIGTKLRFVGYNHCELPGKLKPGTLLRVVAKNGCGMGIDVELWKHGKKKKKVMVAGHGKMLTVGRGRRKRLVLSVDMVWPEEVELA